MKDLRILPKIRDSFSYLYVDQGVIEQDDKSISIFDLTGKTQVPVANLTLLMLGPGTKISHAAVKTTVEAGCLITWTGEESVRFYASGTGETKDAKGIIQQALLFANETSRIRIAKKMYNKRFADKLTDLDSVSLEQLRGKEGARVRALYESEAAKHNMAWHGRNYDRKNWDKSSDVERALGAANACLYGVCHSAIVALGYSPALGFIHTGKDRSFVFDIADLYKAELTIPLAFEIIAGKSSEYEREIRLRLRDEFKNRRILARIVDDIQDLMEVDSSKPSPYDSDPAKPGLLLGDNSYAQGGKNHGGDHS